MTLIFPFIEIIIKFARVLENHNIPVQEVFLFGSYAGKNPRSESDIDLAVISEIFTEDRFENRRKIVPQRRKINTRIELIPFTPTRFAQGGILADEIKRMGIKVEI
jgi:predicted nucleotidyltransferase